MIKKCVRLVHRNLEKRMGKQENYKNFFNFLLGFIVWVVNTSIWAGVWMSEYAKIILRPFGYKGNWLVFAVYAIILFLITSFYGGYRIGYYRRDDVMLSGILSMVITNVITYLQTCLVGRALMHVLPFVLMTAMQAALICLWTYLANLAYQKVYPPRRMLLIYGGDNLARKLIQKMSSRSEKYCIDQAVSEDAGYDAIISTLQGFQSAVLCDLSPKIRNRLLKYCYEKNIRTYTTPKISDVLIRGAANINLFDTPLLLNRNVGLSFEQRVIKRAADIFISGTALLVLWPVMLIVACAIWLYDRGPVLYRQERCTINNKVFSLIKFRSMIVNAEKDGKSQPAIDNDPRITPIGKFLRASRLDELPQLWNILKGDMSIVGPRPERIEHVEKYTAEMPEFVFRAKVKAGLTGYAQVVGRYNTSAYDKLKMDLMYIAGYSVVEDFKLMMMTLKILFVKSSTEGFE